MSVSASCCRVSGREGFFCTVRKAIKLPLKDDVRIKANISHVTSSARRESVLGFRRCSASCPSSSPIVLSASTCNPLQLRPVFAN